MTTQDIYNIAAMAVAAYIKVNAIKLTHQRLQKEFTKRWPANSEHLEDLMIQNEVQLEQFGDTIKDTINITT